MSITKDKIAQLTKIPIDKRDIRNLELENIRDGFVTTEYISLKLVIIERNGYVNITKLINEKVFAKIISNPYIREQLETVAKNIGTVFDSLIINTFNNAPDAEIAGIYVHQKIFYIMLMHFSPNFLEKSLNIISSYFIDSYCEEETESSDETSEESESMSDTKTKRKTETKAKAKTETKPKAKTETKNEPKTPKLVSERKEVKAKTEIKPKTEVKSKTESKPKVTKKPSKPKAKKTADNGEPKPKRALNEYQKYTQKRIPELKKSNPGLPHKEYMRLVAVEWGKRAK